MIDDKKLLVTVTAIALAGVLGLFLYSTTLEPLSLDIGEIGESHIGKIIRTTGTITRARAVTGGSISATLLDTETSASISAFLPPEAAGGEILSPGTLVRVQGEVVLYNEELEISVSRPEDVQVLAAANATVYDLPTLMRSIEMFDGVNVTTSGTMTDIAAIYSNGTLLGTGFSLMNETDNTTYSLECICFGRDLTPIHDDWDDVIVTGEISFYESRGCWQMVVEVVAPRSE